MAVITDEFGNSSQAPVSDAVLDSIPGFRSLLVRSANLFGNLGATPDYQYLVSNVLSNPTDFVLQNIEGRGNEDFWAAYKKGQYSGPYPYLFNDADFKASIDYLVKNNVPTEKINQSYQQGYKTSQGIQRTDAELARSDVSGGSTIDRFLTTVAPIVVAFIAPQLGSTIAAQLAVSEAVGTALASTALQIAAGADPSTAIQNAVTSAVASTGSTAVAQEVNTALQTVVSDPNLANAITNAAGSALNSAAITAARGGSTEDIISNAIAGATGSAVAATTGDKVLGAATTGGLTGGLQGALASAAGAEARLPSVEDATPVPVEQITQQPTQEAVPPSQAVVPPVQTQAQPVEQAAATAVVFSTDNAGNALVMNQDGSIAQVQVDPAVQPGAAVQVDPTTNTATIVEQAPYVGAPTEVAEVPRIELRGMAEPDVPSEAAGVESNIAGRFELPEVPAGGEPLSQVTPVVVGEEEPATVTEPDKAIIDLIQPPVDLVQPPVETATQVTPAQVGGLEPISAPTEPVSTPVEGVTAPPGEVTATAPGVVETPTEPAPQVISIPDQITQVSEGVDTGAAPVGAVDTGVAGVPSEVTPDTGVAGPVSSVDQQIMDLTGITAEPEPTLPVETAPAAVTETAPATEGEVVAEEAAPPEEQIAPQPYKPEFFVAGGVAPTVQTRTPTLAQTLQTPFYSPLATTGLTSYRGAGEIESSETGGKRRNVWNEASLRLKDALGI